MFNTNLVSGQIFPLYTSVRYIEFGTFFQRLDSAFLLIRIIAFISYLGILSNLFLNILKEITQISDYRPLISPLMLLIFGLTAILNTYLRLELFQNHIFKILFFSISIGLGIVILILANIKKKMQNNKC